MSFQKVTHVLFDLDGLIIDSESIYVQIYKELAAKYNKNYTNEIGVKLTAVPDPIKAQIAVRKMHLPITQEEFLKVYLAREAELMQHPNLMPGALELIQHLNSHNIPIAIASATTEETIKYKMQDYHNLLGLFNHTVCGGSDPEVKRGKPAPDIFLICASRFPDQPKPNQCLVFEDSPNGAEGAIAAGMQVVLVPAPDVPEEFRKPATLALNSLEEFKPELFGLPGFK